jgi:hypothetical protein
MVEWLPMDLKFQFGKTDPGEQAPKVEVNPDLESERTKQVSTAGWTAGLSAFFACVTLSQAPTWPMAFGVAAVAGMVAVVCYFILHRE